LSKTASANRQRTQPTRWTRKRLGLALGAIFLAGIVAAALDLRFVIGGSARAVEPNSLLVLEPRSGASLHTVKLREAPAAVAVGPAGVSVGVGAQVVRFDPKTLARLASRPGALSAVVHGDGLSWTVDGNRNRLIGTDRSGRVVRDEVVGEQPVAVATGFGAVWVVNSGNGSITRLDFQNGKVETIELDYQPDEIAAGAGAIWVSSRLSRVLIRIDPKRRTVTKTIRLTSPPVDVAAGDGRAWVAIGH
jgi:virginiamycin B lyase